MQNNSDTITHKLNSKWVIWYHNPSDSNWDIKSYKNVYEIDTLEDYCKFYNSNKLYLPSFDKSMFFMMRKINEFEYIYPMWEDTNNKSGGCWSFKIDSNDIDKIWNILTIYLIGENIGSKTEDSLKINGISISPKKGFCIVKIWNNNSNDKNISEQLNNELLKYFDFESCFYKSHVDNISKDLKKKERYYKKKTINI